MCLLTHYRSSLEFSLENLKAAKSGYESLKNKIQLIDEKSKGISGESYLKDFEKAIDDDLNMPRALQALQLLLKDEKVSGKSKLETIKKMDEVFGLDLLKKEKVSVPAEVEKLAKERFEYKKKKNYKLADELREKINKLGYAVSDKPDGFDITKA